MRTSAGITLLVALNVVAQVFDGIATYIGWEEFGEGNRLLRAGFEVWGAGWTLLVAKFLTVTLLLMLALLPRPAMVRAGLTLTLGLYAAFSILPWSICLFAPDLTALDIG